MDVRKLMDQSILDNAAKHGDYLRGLENTEAAKNVAATFVSPVVSYTAVGPDDVGALFRDKDGALWTMTAYVAEPQAKFERLVPAGRVLSNLATGLELAVVTHVVGCLNYREMGLEKL